MKIGSKVRGLVTSFPDIVPGNVQCPTSNVQPSIHGHGTESLLRHWTFDVRCSMFGVSALISGFRRRPLDEIFPEILVAARDLAWRDICRLDQHHVRRAHVAIHCSLLALVEAGHVAEGNLDNSHRCSQMRARYRICGSSSSAMASTSQRSNSPYKNVDGFWPSSAGLRTVCRKRRISPNVR